MGTTLKIRKDDKRAKYFGDYYRLNTESKRRKAITRANKVANKKNSKFCIDNFESIIEKARNKK